jgi:hypothetical protein
VLGSDRGQMGRSGGGPESWVVLMEGESLFNDATSIVFFEIFFEMVTELSHGQRAHTPLRAQLQIIIFKIVFLAGGGHPCTPAALTCSLLHHTVYHWARLKLCSRNLDGCYSYRKK